MLQCILNSVSAVEFLHFCMLVCNCLGDWECGNCGFCSRHEYQWDVSEWNQNWYVWQLRVCSLLVICSQNRVPGPGSPGTQTRFPGYPDPVPKFLNRFQIQQITTQFTTTTLQNTTNLGLYLHPYTTLNSIMYFWLHIHKRNWLEKFWLVVGPQSVKRGPSESETTNIISCDAPSAGCGFCRAMLCISAAYAVTRCLSCSWIMWKRINVSSMLLHCRVDYTSHSSFSHQASWHYSDGNPPNGGVECKGVWNNDDFRPISRCISERL